MPDSAEDLPIGLIIINPKGKVLTCNALALKFFEIACDQIIGEHIWTVLPELSSTIYRPVINAINTHKPYTAERHYTLLNKWFELTIQPKEHEIYLYFVDLTKQHAIKTERQLFKAVVHNSADAVVITNKYGKTLLFSLAAEKLFGYKEDEVLGKNITFIMNPSDSSHHDQYINRYLKSNISGILGVGPRELVARHKNGLPIEIELAISEFVSEDTLYFVASMRDITIRKDLQRKLEQMAGHDALTGLTNRTLLYDRANQAIAFSARNKHLLALMFIDLDGFKQINDTHGHKTGDKIIKVMADRMTTAIRECDTISRIGGDEFVILLNNINNHEVALSVADKILQLLNQPVEAHGLTVSISGSIGIAYFPDDGETIETLLHHADQAMYQAKSSGKNRIKTWEHMAV